MDNITGYFLFPQETEKSSGKESLSLRLKGVPEDDKIKFNKIFFTKEDAIDYLKKNFQALAKCSDINIIKNHYNNTKLYELEDNKWIIKLESPKNYNSINDEIIIVYLFSTTLEVDQIINKKIIHNSNLYLELFKENHRI